ncbi:MAG: hypothetical protein ACRDMZ_10045, partial [Solirubrobacteraceae bacterium]
ERDIVLDEQPRVFESIIPPDRRRFRSLPGGVPSAEALWSELGSRTLVEIDGDDIVTDLAQHLLTGKNVLVDASIRLGCACAGAVAGAHTPRAQIATLEPPRAASPIIDDAPGIDLELPIPAAPRTPVDVVAISPSAPSPQSASSPGYEAGHRPSPPRGSASVHEVRPPRLSGPVIPRPVLSAFPVARDVEGKSLPRAYVARRRSSPKGITVMLPEEPTADPTISSAPSAPLLAPAPVLAPATIAALTPAVSAALVPTAAEPEIVVSKLVAEEAVISETVIAPAIPAARETLTPVLSTPVPAQSTPVTAPRPAAPVASVSPVPHPTTAPSASSSRASAVPPRPTPREPRDSRELRSIPLPPPAQPTISRGQMVLILLAVAMIAIGASTIVSLIVGRSISQSATPSQLTR